MSFQCGPNLLCDQMIAYNFHQRDAHYEPYDDLENDHKPSSNMKLFGFARSNTLLIAICLTRNDMKIRTYPNFNIGITWFYMEEMSVLSGRKAGNISYADGQGC